MRSYVYNGAMITARCDERLTARMTDVRPLLGVRAGSGLARCHDHLLIVQDDAVAVVMHHLVTGHTVTHALWGNGAALAKADKPDFEAIFEREDGSLWLIGSGSQQNRRLWVRLDPATGEATPIDASDLYAVIERTLGSTPNLEGAVRVGQTLCLFHRAEGRGHVACNAMLEIALEAETLMPVTVSGVTLFDLGAIGSVALTFTDAASRRDGRIIYLAAAEDTPNAIDDGPVVGAAVGIIEQTRARWTRLLEADGSPSVRKVEGLVLDPEGASGYVVTDPDDPARPAELARLVLDGPW